MRSQKQAFAKEVLMVNQMSLLMITITVDKRIWKSKGGIGIHQDISSQNYKRIEAFRF